MAFSVLQSALNTSTVQQATVAVAISTQNVGLGNRLIVLASGNSQPDADSTTTVTDNQGNTYSQHAFVASGGQNDDTVLASLVVPSNIAGTKPTITVTWKLAGANAQFIGQGIGVIEVSGLNNVNGSGALDGVVASASGTTSPASATMGSASSASGQFVLDCVTDNGDSLTYTHGTGYTQDVNSGATNAAQIGMQHKSSTNGVSESGSWTISGTSVWWYNLIAVFKLATIAGGSGRPPQVLGLRTYYCMPIVRFGHPQRTSPTFIQYQRALAGSLSFAGSQALSASKGVSGGLSFAASLQRAPSKGLSAALSFTGTLRRATAKVLAAAGLSFAGAQLRVVGKNLGASLSFTGSQTRSGNKVLAAASLSFSGTLQ
ncbi:MAG: hypothetical protein ACRENL_10770, partial [Candidatus Dormibacteria bacterium]